MQNCTGEGVSNWEDYRVLLAVMEAGSLNSAARRLGVNHATVLRRVNAFEAQIGVTIFDRNAAGYRMLASQLGLREALRDMAAVAERVERALQGQVAGVAGPLRITSTDSLCHNLLPRIVVGLQNRHPELQVELMVSNAHVDLGRLEAEVTVRPALALPADLTGDKVADMAIRPYATPGYLARANAVGDGYHWLTGAGPLERALPMQWVAENVPAERIVQRTDSFLTMRGLVRLGLGVAYLPAILVSDTDSLVPVPDAAPPLEVGLWVAHHRDLETVARIQACRVYLAEALSARAEMLAGTISPE